MELAWIYSKQFPHGKPPNSSFYPSYFFGGHRKHMDFSFFFFFFIYHAYLSAQKNYRDIFQLVMPCFKRFWLLLGRKIPVMPILEVYSPTSQEIADFSNVAKLQKCVSWWRNLRFHFGFLFLSTIGGYIMIKKRKRKKNYFLIGLEFFF